MKIAFIGQKGVPATRGEVEKYVEKLALGLVERGHEVFIYVRNNYTGGSLNIYKGIKLIHLPSIPNKNLETISHTFFATVHSIFSKYDVIHYQGIGPSSLSFIPKFLKRKTLVVSTFYYRNYLNNKWGSFAKKYLQFGEWVTCKIPDKTIVISKHLRNYVFNKYKTKATYIPNGTRVEYNPETKALERWDLKDKKYILSVGEISKHKGIKNLIEAFKKNEDTNKLANNFKLVIIDNGFRTDVHTRKIRNAKKSIIFTNNQTGATLEQLFSHAYLFVQPSESEGLSQYLLDAMGYGIAPLVSDIPENVEIIGRSGFTFRSISREDLENKLAYLINKQTEVEKMGKMAKDRIQKEYSWDGVARKNLKIYESNPKSSNKLSFRKIQRDVKSYV